MKPDKQDVFSRGHICPKAVALKDLHEDPDRLRQPLRRLPGGGWETISWASAFEEIEARIKAVRAQYGSDAVAAYAGNPTAHNLGAILSLGDFVRAIGSRNFYSASSVDQWPHMLAAWAMYGHQFLMPVPDIDHTQLFVCIGGNPVASGGSIMGAPGFEKRVDALKARGGRFIVIDPRRTESARIADEYLPIRPGADVYLLLGLVKELFEEKLTELGALAAHVEGVADIEQAVSAFALEEMSAACGIEAERIRALAREIAREPRALVYGRVGACTQEFGGLVAWLINVVNLLTAHLDAPGGMMFPQPAVDLSGAYGSRGHRDRYRSRVRQLPEFGSELPVAALAEEIETPGPGQVRALITFAGNPVLSTPNGRRLDRALDGLEYMVSVDMYLNETTRHADIILPPTSPLERSHYDVALAGFAVRNFAKYSPPLFPKPDGAMHDNEILMELAERLAAPGGRGAMARRIKRRLGPDRLLDWMLRTGRYGVDNTGLLGLASRLPGGAGLRALLSAAGRRPMGLTLRRLIDAPHGIDLGALEPSLAGRLETRDGRIHAAPQIFLEDLARAQVALADRGNGLLLIGRRHVRSNNSWMHNSQRLVKGKPRCTLLVNPGDAAARGLADGEEARLVSRVGSLTVPVEVTEDVMPGVVCLPHGWGHDRPGIRLSVAAQHAGVSMNDLTDDEAVDLLSGNAVLNGTPVDLQKIAAA